MAIAGGRSHSAAVTADGDVYCWGDSSDFQCGTGSLQIVATPTRVKIIIKEGFCKHGFARPETPVVVDNVACGATHTLALSVEDEVWAWGCGEQLGFEELMHSPLPRRLDALCGRRVLMVACGDSHSLALLQKAERTSLKTNASPARHRNVVLKENVVTHKHFPSLCAKCNKEIYTYTEAGDTCIIEADHECGPDESVGGLESSLALSDDEPPPPSSQLQLQLQPQPQPKPKVLPAAGSSSVAAPLSLDWSKWGIAVVAEKPEAAMVEGSRTEAPPVTARLGKMELKYGLGSRPTSRASGATPGQGDGVSAQHGDQKLDPDNDPAAATQLKRTSPDGAQTQVHTDADSLGDGAQKPGVHKSMSVESDGEVWKRQSASEEKVLIHFEEKVTSMDRHTPLASSCSTSSWSTGSSATNLASTSKARSFMDDSQARDYLARQFEDEKSGEACAAPLRLSPEKEEPGPQSPQSSWTDFLPSSSASMMETMKTMTSKALTNFQSTMDSLVGQQNMELGDMSESGAAAADAAIRAAVQAMTSGDMNDSSSSVELGLDAAVQDSPLEEDPGGSSQPPPNLSKPEDSLEGRQSLRTLEMKQQNIEKRISARATKGWFSCCCCVFLQLS